MNHSDIRIHDDMFHFFASLFAYFEDRYYYYTNKDTVEDQHIDPDYPLLAHWDKNIHQYNRNLLYNSRNHHLRNNFVDKVDRRTCRLCQTRIAWDTDLLFAILVRVF